MYIPEYTITSEILKNIATIEYGRSVIETTTVLPHWRKQLQKEAKVKFIKNSLGMDELNFDEDDVKAFVDGIGKKIGKEAKNALKALEKAEKLSKTMEFDEDKTKTLHKELTVSVVPQTKQGKYRSEKVKGHSNPESILAEMVGLFDWYNSLDAKETHCVIVAGIIHIGIEIIKPFEHLNSTLTNLTSKMCLNIGGYDFDDFLSTEEIFNKDKRGYEEAVIAAVRGENDLTGWLEYYTDAMAREVSNAKEQILLLARDTKIAKASGRVELTPRQERVVEFLQDYGLLKNKDFNMLFPDVSEDTVLRDLKVLMNKGIVVKRGKTKSSRYELK